MSANLGRQPDPRATVTGEISREAENGERSSQAAKNHAKNSVTLF
jgi:hypothetical protein